MFLDYPFAQCVLRQLLNHSEWVAKSGKKKEPIIIAAKLEIIGIKRDPPKNLRIAVIRFFDNDCVRMQRFRQ